MKIRANIGTPIPIPTPMPDREGIGLLVWAIIVAGFALFGATARLLFQWDPRSTWIRSLGNLLVSVFAAWMIGLCLWEPLDRHPTVLLASCGAAAWLGGDILDRLARKLLGGL